MEEVEVVVATTTATTTPQLDAPRQQTMFGYYTTYQKQEPNERGIVPTKQNEKPGSKIFFINCHDSCCEIIWEIL